MSALTKPFDPKSILDSDPWLEPFIPAIESRYKLYQKWRDNIFSYEGGYDEFSKGFLSFGLNVDENNQITYREWAPNAKEANLIGDFSSYFLTYHVRHTANRHLHTHISHYLPQIFSVIPLRRLEQNNPSNDEEQVWCLGDYYPSQRTRSSCNSTRFKD